MIELPPGTLVDRYGVVEKLGEGGMASVYHVQHTRLSSHHVLKLLSIPGKSVRERLLLEGQVQAALKHRNIVEVTDVVDYQGAPGLVMELVRGPSLADLIDGGPLPLEAVEQIVPGILAGVQAAHEQGVVHRDLKPDNILLSLRRSTVVPKVADFGLVKLVDDDGKARTRTGATMGTPQYMAPEQIKNSKDVDARTDVFALGVVLYELVTGHRPFEADSPYDIFQKIMEVDYRPVRELSPDTPQRMCDAIDAAIQPLDERVATVEALWTLWCGGSESLDKAAGVMIEWPDELLERARTHAPQVSEASTTFSSRPPSSGAPSTSGGAAATFGPESMLDEPSAPSLPTVPVVATPAEAPRKLPVVGLLVALALLLVGGVTCTGLIAIGVQRGAPTPATQPVPTGPVQAPEPAPAPVPQPPTPPIAPTPAPVVPPIRPEPVRPRPTTPPQPAPTVTAATAKITVTGGVPVRLVGKAGTFRGGGEVPPGTYELWGDFEKGSTSAGRVTFEAGGEHVIHCVEKLNRCILK